MGLLRTILIFIIITYVIRLFTRYIVPALFFNYMDDKSREFRQHKDKRQREQEKAKRREGEVSIDYKPDRQDKNKPRPGVYVDYEEIKE